MVTQQTAVNTVKSFASELQRSGLQLKKVILFGSYAKNTQNEDSDIDVALVADDFTGLGIIDIRMFVKTLKNYVLIQPRTFSSDYFNQGDPFIEEIIKTGIEISPY
ncbi:MAG: nucleotidyltransferase domain-containing protein [Bacteroidetes bacterium]|nr:nucleotidyltransferase domain-containing protein [Bacteroidota bacterium]